MNKAYVVRDNLKHATHTRAGATISAATRTELDGALDALDDAQIAIDQALEHITNLIDMPAGDTETEASSEERAARARGYQLVDAEQTGYTINGTPVMRPRKPEPLGDVQIVRRPDKPQPGSPGFTLSDAE